MVEDKKKNDESIKQNDSEQETISFCPKKSMTGQSPCVCDNTDGVFVASRYLSGVIACATMVIFCTFMVGFFAGKRFVVQSFLDKTAQDCFSDQVYASLCALTDKEIETGSMDDDTGEQDVDGDDDIASGVTAMAAINSALATPDENSDDKQESVEGGSDTMRSNGIAHDEPSTENEQEQANIVSSERYYAQLIGFSTLRAAQKYAQKLCCKGFEVEVKKRISKTAQSKRVAWYQVISCLYDNKRELEKFVDRIMQQEKIKDIKITTVY